MIILRLQSLTAPQSNCGLSPTASSSSVCMCLRSHVIESSFAEWSVWTWSPPDNFVSGHSLTICDTLSACCHRHTVGRLSYAPYMQRSSTDTVTSMIIGWLPGTTWISSADCVSVTTFTFPLGLRSLYTPAAEARDSGLESRKLVWKTKVFF